MLSLSSVPSNKTNAGNRNGGSATNLCDPLLIAQSLRCSRKIVSKKTNALKAWHLKNFARK
jgi:hypothetical protein